MRTTTTVAVLGVLAVLVGACAPPPPEAARPVASVDGWNRTAVVRETIDPVARYHAATGLADGAWLLVGDLSHAPGALLQPAAWRSTDGRRWDPATFPTVDGTSATVTAVAASPERVVAVGRIGMGPQADPVAWRSADGGRTWEAPARLSTPDGLEGAEAAAVSGGPEGFVAGGGPVEGVPGGALLWRSDDGRTWERLDAPGEADEPGGADGGTGTPAPVDRVSVVRLASSGTTTVGVLGRWPGAGAVAAPPATIRSTDRRSFTAGGALDLAEPAPALVGTSGGFVALGGRVATSADGVAWATADLPRSRSSSTIALRSPEQLAVDGERVVARTAFGAVLALRTGVELDADRLADPEAWDDLGRPADVSELGVLAAGTGRVVVVSGPMTLRPTGAWIREPDGAWLAARPRQLPDQQRTRQEWIADLAAGDGIVVAVGGATDATGLAAPPATSGAPAPPATGPVVSDTGPPSGAATDELGRGGRAWWSVDGRVWTEAILSSAVRSVDAVARRGAGFVAVGHALDASGNDETLLFSSADGKGWSFGGRLPADSWPRDLLVVGNDLLAVGSTGDDDGDDGGGGGRPAAWRSGDGGATWAAEPLPVGDGDGVGRLEAACTGPSGTVVVGQASSGPLLLVAADGGWRRLDVPAGAAAEVPRACAVAGDGAVAVVAVGPPDDGTQAPASSVWSAPAPGGPYARGVTGPGVATAVVHAGGRWVVAGDAAVGTGAVVWAGTDGGTWRHEAPVEALTAGDPRVRVAAVVVLGDRLVLGGGVADAPLVITQY